MVGGLFGALILEPAVEIEDAAADAVAAIHTYPGGQRTINGATGDGHHRAEAGATVRVRLINTDGTPTSAWVTGAAFRVLAIDGTDLQSPGEVQERAVGLTAGARADLEVLVPSRGAVRVQVPGASLVIGPDGADADTSAAPRESVDLLTYGEPADVGMDPADAERTFTYDIGRLPGFLDGVPGYWWTINGGLLPAVPMYMVDEGDTVVMRIVNNSGEVHPMHLHGHHLLVLSRDGHPSTGSPWWVDSLDVEHRRVVRRGVRRRQSRHLDGPLPQPAPRGGGPDDPPRVHRRHNAVPPRSRLGQRPGVSRIQSRSRSTGVGDRGKKRHRPTPRLGLMGR